MRSVYLFFLITLVGIEASAQTNRYMVFFTDKANTPYSVDSPEAFLSEKSLTRRANQEIQVTERDLPADPSYVQSLKDAGASVLYTSRWMNAALISSTETIVADIENLAHVRKLELVAPGSGHSRKSGYGFYFDMGRIKGDVSTLQNGMMGVNDMHEAGYKGNNKLIAVFDGGFLGVDTIRYFRHLYENNKIVATHDFTAQNDNVYRYDDHGTNVFSCLGGYLEGIYSGTAPEADYVLCVTEAVQSEYRIEEYNWLFAAEFADSLGVDIINSSLGYNKFDDPSMNYVYSDLNGDIAVITQAADWAAAAGMLVVTSAGNERNDAWKYIVPPADADSVLSVGAANASFNPTGFTSAGPTFDNRQAPKVSALGNGTIFANSSGKLVPGNGTSYAAPLIAGMAAGIWQALPDLTNMELINVLKSSGTLASEPDSLLGYGVPDYNKIRGVILSNNSYVSRSFYQIYPNPVKDNSFFLKPGNDNQRVFSPTVTMHSLKGDLIHTLDLQKDPAQDAYQIELPEIIPDGIYILAILDGDNQETIRIIKQ